MGRETSIQESSLLKGSPVLFALYVILTEQREDQTFVNVFGQELTFHLGPLNGVDVKQNAVRRKPAVALQNFQTSCPDDHGIGQSTVALYILNQRLDVIHL